MMLLLESGNRTVYDSKNESFGILCIVLQDYIVLFEEIHEHPAKKVGELLSSSL